MMYGLYVHIPFCRAKCNYCDFCSRPLTDAGLADRYITSVILEMQRYRKIPLATLYVGGGTPSMLAPESFKTLFSAIKQTFDCDLSEVTVEANPESLNEEILAVLRELGATRLSIGVQSFDNEDLKYLGRVHAVADFWDSYASARRLGFRNISVDLIYGLPSQSPEAWQDVLKTAVIAHSEHISLYPLVIEPRTPLHDRNVRIDEDAQAQMYEWSLDFLENAGYEHYEISNWAKPGFRSAHNMIYWQNGQYIGLGASAASHVGNKRWKNHADVDKYMNCVFRNENIIGETEELNEKKVMSENLILKLRCLPGMYVSPEIDSRYGGKINELVKKDLLQRSGKNISLTRKGMLFASQVMKEFV
ncbi:MAG: radical SAM family heme chaperone HemW [Endomicrobiales bacterium]|nr:radical SAM family heme chaperone HemW [Endomicrobiales bacterium]